jgi:cystathionine gamma-lyase
MNDATRVVRAGLPDPEQGTPFLPGPTFAAPFHLSGDPATAAYGYGRNHNPTWTAYERAITELEEAAATVVFSSGMAAIMAVFGVTLRPGDHLLMLPDGYYTGRSLASDFFETYGVKVRMMPRQSSLAPEMLRDVRLVLLETPTNPNLDVYDIAEFAAIAHSAGVLLAVDNTTPSCLGQQPLKLGADFSLASDTKITTGHSDLVLGHVSSRDQAWIDKLQTWRKQTGSVPGPMEVWLAHRSLATLHVRMERQSQNALAVAQFLASRADVQAVRYPGLSTDPSHLIASRQMKFYGPVVSFTLSNREAAERFLMNSRLVLEATSFGSVHTSAERRARWGGDDVPPGFIRMSVGCEDSRDLIDDLRLALDKAAS